MKKILFQGVRSMMPALEGISSRKAALAAFQVLRLPNSKRKVQDRFAERVFDAAENLSLSSDSNQIQVYRWTLPTRGPRPTRPVVFLIHDWNSSSRAMAGLVSPLVLAGFDTVAIDLPGHGFSSGLFAELPACLRALKDVSSMVGEPKAIIGHGLGGAIAALSVASRSNYPAVAGVERLVLISSPDRMTDVVNRFAEEFLEKSDTLYQLHELVDGFLQGPSSCFSTSSAVWSSGCPTLVIHDKNNPIIPHEDALSIASQMKDGMLISTEGLGHRRILRSKRVSREIARFIEMGQAAHQVPMMMKPQRRSSGRQLALQKIIGGKQ